MPMPVRLLMLVVAYAIPFSASAEIRIEKESGDVAPVPSDPYAAGGEVKESDPLSTRMSSDAAEQIRLEVGETKLIHISEKVVRVSVADPNVSDVQVVTPKQVLITASAVGYTHLILWGISEKPLVIAVSVTRNLDELRSQFKELFPGERIVVSSVGDLVVLSGTVSDLRIPARAAEVAALHSERLANLIQVSGDQQVQLDVRFAEVSRSAMREVGMNFLWRDTQRGYVSGVADPNTTMGKYVSTPGTGGAPVPPPVPSAPYNDAFNIFFSTGLSQFPFSTVLSILSQEGLAKMLAEPSLTALSGQEAEFHAGGEVPVLSTQSLGATSVDYKKFGVRLKFTPTVLGEKSISLKLGIEVSEPDPTVGIALNGNTVVGFRSRSSDTTIRLKDGQSFAIAGLLSDSVRRTVKKVPFLGDIPILGTLFRSNGYRRDETELLMVVTARLVRPLTPDEVPFLPGENMYNDPRDIEFFMLGTMRDKKTEEAKKKEDEDERKRLREDANKKAAKGKQAKHETPLPMEIEETRLISGPAGPVGFIRQ